MITDIWNSRSGLIEIAPHHVNDEDLIGLRKTIDPSMDDFSSFKLVTYRELRRIINMKMRRLVSGRKKVLTGQERIFLGPGAWAAFILRK